MLCIGSTSLVDVHILLIIMFIIPLRALQISHALLLDEAGLLRQLVLLLVYHGTEHANFNLDFLILRDGGIRTRLREVQACLTNSADL
jgi:hypothetical protein